ncbi:pilin [Stenotrophomonas maltophilia]|uniref:pilin n=1 Tax=Stenotrophomonas maltophilia TaxID=40324 RepID=UPI001CB7B5C6|nr:pilin [Stenotrophomonas maltophilia]
MDVGASRTSLRDAASVLGGAIAAVENSYAESDLTVTDQHLGLPASAAHCARLRASLPDSGRAVLTCDLRQDGRVQWWRTPAGEWRCNASMAEAPAPCPTELRPTF